MLPLRLLGPAGGHDGQRLAEPEGTVSMEGEHMNGAGGSSSEPTTERSDGDTIDRSSFAANCRKRSFLKLPVPVDVDTMVQEYQQVPESAWGQSYWDVHCSIDALLLRGGGKGEPDDYTTADVSNSPLLEDMPYLASLLAPEGPFGGAHYAFVFRMEANGITRVHEDDHESWKAPVRIHIPIETNPGAFLLSEANACHYGIGEVWTFDNQIQHAVVNGDTTRVHLIFDVQPNPKLAELMGTAHYDPGTLDLASWARAGGRKSGGLVPPLTLASGRPLDAAEKTELQLDPDGFATRVLRVGRKGKLARTSLKPGDVITAIDGVEADIVWDNALDHLKMKHGPGETVAITVLRGGVRAELAEKLRSPDHLSPSSLLGKVGLRR